MSRDQLNAGLKGGSAGLALGLAAVTFVLATQEAFAAPLLLLPLATFAGGFVIGLLRAKQS